MRKLMMQVGMTGLLALALAAPAAAGSLYKWTGADGAVSYTDDLKRVPDQYRASAVQTKTRGLRSYERFTPETEKGKDVHRERLDARLERLRAINADHGAPPQHSVAMTQTVVRVNDRLSLAVPNDVIDAGEPVVVEELRVRDPSHITTRHVTVVKQGDRVISVIRPKATNNGANWGDESELFPDAD